MNDFHNKCDSISIIVFTTFPEYHKWNKTAVIIIIDCFMSVSNVHTTLEYYV